MITAFDFINEVTDLNHELGSKLTPNIEDVVEYVDRDDVRRYDAETDGAYSRCLDNFVQAVYDEWVEEVRRTDTSYITFQKYASPIAYNGSAYQWCRQFETMKKAALQTAVCMVA